jgi:hypothetical protein
MRLDVDVSRMAGPSFTGVALSPNGRQIALTTGAVTTETWVLEHFLPDGPNQRP